MPFFSKIFNLRKRDFLCFQIALTWSIFEIEKYFHFFPKLKVFLFAGPLRHTGNERQLEQISECGFSCGPVQEGSIVVV